MAGALGRAPRGDSAVRYPGVGSREKNGEGSAWLARLGAPRAAVPPCGPEEGGEGHGGRGKTPSSAFFPENFFNRACNPL